MLGWVVVIVAWLWTLAAMVVGVRQALDYKSTWRAVAVCVIGFVGQLLVIYLEWMVLRTALST
jgi:1-acyl-sn-glycerol-3-phosphate acyltransferase